MKVIWAIYSSGYECTETLARFEDRALAEAYLATIADQRSESGAPPYLYPQPVHLSAPHPRKHHHWERIVRHRDDRSQKVVVGLEPTRLIVLPEPWMGLPLVWTFGSKPWPDSPDRWVGATVNGGDPEACRRAADRLQALCDLPVGLDAPAVDLIGVDWREIPTPEALTARLVTQD